LILADTAIWVDHLHQGDDRLEALLDADLIVIHPHVIGEIAVGSLRNRMTVLNGLRHLPQVMMADEEEVLGLINQKPLFNVGIGYVDAHLLAAALLTPGIRVWTRDRRMGEAAERLGVAGGP
jgi:predicted nucleic acid-binding protein